MYTFFQSSGRINAPDGSLLGIGCAGQGIGFNNPSMQGAPNIGPLPRGFYKIGPPHDHPKLGPLTMNLEPFPENEMFGRSKFRIHGYAKVHPELSSEGCIVQFHDVRKHIADHLTEDDLVEVKE